MNHPVMTPKQLSAALGTYLSTHSSTFKCSKCGLHHTFGTGERGLRGARLLARLHTCHPMARFNHVLDQVVLSVVVVGGPIVFAMSFIPSDTQYYVPSVWALIAAIWAWSGRKARSGPAK